MNTNSINWRWPRKAKLLVTSALLLLQNFLVISEIYAEETSSVYIVYTGDKIYQNPETAKKYHLKMLSSLLGSKEAAKNSILYSYKHGFSGFAARLTKSQAEEIEKFPEVVSVIRNRIHKLHTTRSWDFIGIHHSSSKTSYTENNLGEGTIIGVIDTGIWPESRSFNDEAMGQIPSRWKGVCEVGEQFNTTNCNKKIIGARWFMKGITDHNKNLIHGNGTKEFLSARDAIGHGTHTASTAAGYYVENANYRGLAYGLARGGAPLAHLAIYKACWDNSVGGCADADILKAFDKAIHDGVDVLTVSLGVNIPLFSYVDQRDTIAIGSFHATAKGITVVCSAGNSGPISQTIANTAPWIVTVAATTIDRAFQAAITLGNNNTVWGQSIDTGKHNLGFVGLTYSERIALDPANDLAKDCQYGSLNATMAAGKIVLCFSVSDQQDIISASRTVMEAGGVGLIYAQFHEDGLYHCGVFPCIKVDYEVGTQILSYIRRTRFPTASLSLPKTVIGKLTSPQVSSFSSRGPSSMSPTVLKPDIAAPGVDILAAFPPQGTTQDSGFALLSGTSMSCPHVAGIAALIKSKHPTWSPAAIRSALVTTASQTGTDGSVISEEGSTYKAADPFDIGGGHVNPNKAMDPGLIYNITTDDYIHFLCSIGYGSASISKMTKTNTKCKKEKHQGLNLNLPSISIPYLKKGAKVMRTVTNVGNITSVYKAQVKAPDGIKVRVEPQILSFNSSSTVLSFNVSFLSTLKLHGGYRFGSLTWTNGKHFVRVPIAVRTIQFES
ncbi:PREDICTED: subtilisin-like protease SBT3.9 isoform X1 [Lupinus angustifolius]|uniref:subtilisin-like protease SBT3.9 isoform X1 n=1 Tax=Lupinus angustifolius TaxID=3871 RepID=UPI00092EEDE1|nr:PREDICTED: subtilisin-like protease SBT3.9 isoform X1 [Lupinus angustifolius]